MQLDAKVSADVTEMGDVAKAAESLGFRGIRLLEMAWDPFILLAAAGLNSTNLTLSTSVALAFTKSPTSIAYTAWDLQKLSGGRLHLGLGPQVKAHIERRFGLEWGSPAPRMKDYVQALRAIWASWQNGEKLDHRGRFYELSLMPKAWNPGSIDFPDIPVTIAAVGPGMLKVAGAVSDGVHVHPIHTLKYLHETVLPKVAEGAATTGRDSSEVKLTTMPFVITGRNADELKKRRDEVRTRIAFYACTPAYRGAILEPHGWAEVGQRLSAMGREQRWSEMGDFLPDEMEREIAVTGEWDEIGPQLLEKYGGLMDVISLYKDFRMGEQDEFWKLLAESLAED